MRYTPELNSAHWRRSSYSNANGGACVEISEDFPGVVPIRDSKNPHGPALTVPTLAWDTFIRSLKS
ncbi:DUF397 domain-containing protein [Streptomyces acidiscabies]|uniref:DUF397 domain-containing protein n=1 Tax=Streptomyces acidiscabies TaxID=42234 RepID=A0AAP6BMH5_9ACTN|nr:DUF397 domain-containing protein [Streptomyces acidiscabies]MBP5940134.1 DUF397 domain-containing protein [Streptomyces sp. LBUM 1476]MBZ3911342.1 DUF397 domain-containing protein [Streptomyces acidiscabies]MDX2967438.1 DUF397 domain-containing protein [Streptomyces acidiscabies]MDX3026196.1 DUF397 domain-containing protein [Streptomyces acidiscabies]MDX3797120.1 DUF397 domain-containing protein [Streptomyces acidiscabies]